MIPIQIHDLNVRKPNSSIHDSIENFIGITIQKKWRANLSNPEHGIRYYTWFHHQHTNKTKSKNIKTLTIFDDSGMNSINFKDKIQTCDQKTSDQKTCEISTWVV